MAARRVAAEAGGDAVDSDDDSADAPAGLFLPAEPKRRADWLAGAPLRTLAVEYWTTKTRPTSCVKNVVRIDEKDHPVHWLENTIENFHHAFIEEGTHYYPTQLKVRGAPAGTTAASVRKAFEQWKPSRVNPLAQGKYFYVVFSSKSECAAALLASRAHGFALSASIVQRPLMGITAFTNERPAFVKDVTAVSCACHRCYGMTLMFKGLMQFRHWD